MLQMNIRYVKMKLQMHTQFSEIEGIKSLKQIFPPTHVTYEANKQLQIAYHFD